MSESIDPKVELAMQKGIRQAEDDLVQWVEAALDETTYGTEKKDKDKKLDPSQFQNLVRVADTTESVEVIKNFLRYQVGRGGKWGRSDDSLANRIISDIDNKIKAIASQIAKETQYPHQKKIHIELVRRYLGYGSRYLRYLNPS